MKRILLKSLSLVNFKGVRDFQATVSESGTVVSGENGTGKTTLYDAYLWLLFGKDSEGRSDFDVKTLDEAGKPIYRLEHSVTGVFDIDGKEIKLQRSLVEVWRKVNGTTNEEMKDETRFFINDVRTGTKKEYQAEISEIIPEDVFRMITNPSYFPNLSPDTQRDMLFDIAGNITDNDVAELNPEFLELLDKANGTSLIKWAKEISMKKRSCNEILTTIPASIETAQKLRPEDEDWVALDVELADKRKAIAEIDAQIADKAAAADVESKRKDGLLRKRGNLKMQIVNRETAIRIEANEERNKAIRELQELQSKVGALTQDCEFTERDAKAIAANVANLETELAQLREQFKAIAREQFVAPEAGSLTCPTCGEPFKGDNLERKIDEMRGNFERNKAQRQKSVQAKGMELKERYTSGQTRLTQLNGKVSRLNDQILELRGEINHREAHIPNPANVDELIAKDTEVIRLNNEYNEVNNALLMEAKPIDISDLNEAKVILNEAITELTKRLAKREQVERAEREIAELEEKRVSNLQALAELERWEDLYTRFVKTKDEMLNQRINGLFHFVTFSFVKEQKNGGEKTTCICKVKGVPYATANAASKVNAGLDIINAICTAKGISAPIFIDNRESINTLIPCVSQIINLVVSKDPVLTIQH